MLDALFTPVVRIARVALIVAANAAMRVRPLLQVGKTANAVEIFNDDNETVSSITRPDAFAFEAIVITPVDVLRDFLNVALRVNRDIRAVRHVIAEVQFTRSGGHLMRCPPLVFNLVLACLLACVNQDFLFRIMNLHTPTYTQLLFCEFCSNRLIFQMRKFQQLVMHQQ